MVISKQTSLMMTFVAMIIVSFNSNTAYMKVIALLIAAGCLFLVYKERKNNK